MSAGGGSTEVQAGDACSLANQSSRYLCEAGTQTARGCQVFAEGTAKQCQLARALYVSFSPSLTMLAALLQGRLLLECFEYQ